MGEAQPVRDAMDLVWLCRGGPNEELRYSIRSATQNLEHDNVWVAGDKPNWYSGPFIKAEQIDGKKYDNVKRSLINVIMSDQVSDSFILMNDDFFILKPTDLDYYYSGTLGERIKKIETKSPNALYANRLKDTMHQLQDAGIEQPLDYELHKPMKLDKQGLALALDFPQFRSAYGNLNQVGGQQTADVKVYSNRLYQGMSYNWDIDSEFVSTDDGSFDNIERKLLRHLFPDPTIYERN
jgi:hypothetical protein